MKFLIIRRADADTEAGVMPSQDLLQAMGEYNTRMVDAGVFVDGMGLQASKKGARVDFHGGKPVVTDGPFAETKELIAGFSVIEAACLQEAIEWARQWPPEDAGGEASLEIRQVFGMEDFEPGDGLAVHEQLQARMNRQPERMNYYLNFNGDCAKAMHFYADVLGGEISMMRTWGDMPATEQRSEECSVPDEMDEKIMHAQLDVSGLMVMGCDVPPGTYQAPQGMFIQLDLDSADKAEQLFSALSEKGRVIMPMETSFFAERFGMLVDRFSIPWMIHFRGNVAF